MKGKPQIGLTGTVRFTVGPEHVIDFASGEMPTVLSPPWIVKFMEQAGREALRPLLADGEATVGVEIELRHLAPTPLGASVTCTARVIATEDRLVTFQVEARDEVELIARGTLRRAVVSQARFAARVAARRR